MRTLKKSWQDKRPGWTCRVRWYEAGDGDIRLEFVDHLRRVNRFYRSEVQAQIDYDAFRLANSYAVGERTP